MALAKNWVAAAKFWVAAAKRCVAIAMTVKKGPRVKFSDIFQNRSEYDVIRS
jgi:hypothetical protein